MPKNVDTLEEAVSTGATIVGYKAESDGTYTVDVLEAQGETTTFPLIKPDALKELSKQAKLKKSWKASVPKEATSPKAKKPPGVTVEKCIQSGGKVVDSHKTTRGNYAVHITTSDGATHSFSNVSKDHLVGVEGFKEE